MFSLGLLTPQQIFAADPPTHLKSLPHIRTVDKEYYSDVFGRDFRIVWITYRDGTKSTVVYDADGKFYNSFSGHQNL